MRFGMNEDLSARLGKIIEATVRLAHELKYQYGFDPSPQSQGAKERDSGIVAGGHRLILEAGQMAETRLVATAGHLQALGSLLERPDQAAFGVFAISGLARTALELSARAAWLLDPRIDGWTRGLRGMAEMLYSFSEEAKYPAPPIQESARRRLAKYVAAAESAGLAPAPHRDRPEHFGEPRLGATGVIKAQMGAEGELTYRELSGIAHGNITALLRLTENVSLDEWSDNVVPREEGISLTQPVIATHVLPLLAVVHRAYAEALEFKVRLFGWDQAFYKLRRIEIAKAMVDLMRALPGVGTDA